MKLPKQIEQELKIIGEFLETEEGKAFFAEISEAETRQQKYDKRITFLRVPANVRRWLDQLEKCKKRIGM